MKKALLSILLSVVLASSQVLMCFAAYDDTENHWAKDEIQRWSDVKIINGSDGKFRPDEPILRCEVSAVVNRLLKYKTVSDANYEDVSSDMWFYEDVKRVSPVMQGDTNFFRPYDFITREEAIVLVCKILKIDKQTIFAKYKPDHISSWAKGYVSALEDKNCLPDSFDDNNFGNNITRAELIYIFDRLIDSMYLINGHYSIDTSKNIVLQSSLTDISNMTVKGNIIVSESADGIKISNVDVNGIIYVCGKNENVILDNVVADKIVFESREKSKYYNSIVDGKIDVSSVLNLPSGKNGYGPGTNVNGDNRPTGAVKLQNTYSKYDAYFIAEKSDKIYLTFDEGYENGYTEKILDILKEKNCTAVFFVTMDYVKKNPALVRRMIDEGHVLGNHSVNHLSMPTLSVEKCISEIVDLHKYVREKFNYEMFLFRPPMGEYSEKTLAIAQKTGYKTFLWSFAYKDWEVDNQPEKGAALKKITNSVHGGGIYLLHAVSKTNTEILPSVIDNFRNYGYTVKAFEIGDK